VITFALRCEPGGHSFDGWFRSSDDFETQNARHLVACPVCGTTAVEKALMRPALAGTKREAGPDEAAKMLAALQHMAREARAKADYVGPGFAEEARRIHYGETPARQIYGEASPPEVKGLVEEGIPVLPMPPLPEDKN
jgi:hypothetical protein